MLSLKCQAGSRTSKDDVMVIDIFFGFGNGGEKLSFECNEADRTATVVIDAEQAAVLGAQLTAWAKKHLVPGSKKIEGKI